MSSPMVMDMDGDTIPDVVFNSFSGRSYQGNGIIRIVNGKTGKLIASSTGKDNEGNGFMTDGGSQVALGDLDGDTIPEIVTCSDQYRLATYKFDPKTKQISLLWKSNNPIQECGQGGPGIADFDGDIPGASPRDCGNYMLNNLPMAKWEARKYLVEVLECAKPENLLYPED